MIGAWFFSAVLAQAAPAAEPTAVPMPPADWRGLPELPLRRAMPALPQFSTFVAGEVAAGRCAASIASAAGRSLRAEVAVLVDAAAHVRRIVPRAIDCPAVEQYASGLVLRMVRANVRPSTREGWYKVVLTFNWPS